MTIRQMALVQSIQKSGPGYHTAAEIEEAHRSAHKQAGTIEGMCVNCYGDHIHDKVELSDSAVQQVKDLVLTSAKDGYGWNDTPYLNDFTRSYVQTVAVDKRLATSRALQQTWREEVNRLGWYIHSKNPNWTSWGQPFNLSILDDYKQGIDVKA